MYIEEAPASWTGSWRAVVVTAPSSHASGADRRRVRSAVFVVALLMEAMVYGARARVTFRRAWP